tara:strand:- start:284 stop:472 length:189 start_codon:yes stop_codon:yes gene_type:complete
MNIIKVFRSPVDSNGVRSLIIQYDSNYNFAFSETDSSKEKYKDHWDAIQAWVSAGNTIEEQN